ncbi:MAG: V-type ATP synthase subunit I [Eubacteriales bacterium]|nr:V-type ATP synthase subunit I [Eubacteriales bacterium]
MKRVTLIAHADRKSAVLKALQNIGAVEIVTTNEEDLSPARLALSLGGLETRLDNVRESLALIRKYDDAKTPFLMSKPGISRSALKDMRGKFLEADEAIQKIKRFSFDMTALKTRRQQIKNKIIQLEPYEKFDAPLESVGTGRYSKSLLGTIPSENEKEYIRIREEYGELACFETVDEQNDIFSVYVIMHHDIYERLTGELKFIGFSEAYTKDLYGTPRDLIFDYKNELESLHNETKEYEKNALRFSEDKPMLQALEDYLINEIERERCVEHLGETGATFMLEGWVTADDQDHVEKTVLDIAPESYIAFRDPEEDEMPPTAFANAKAVAPFEAVTTLYSVPSAKGFDSNFLMSIFYFLIFGMMIADFAYGLILTFGALLVLKLKKPDGMFRKVTTVIMICGISTSLWGLFFGTIFSIEGVPSIINPLEDAMSMLIICLGIGIIHLMFGLGMGAYINIKRGKVWSAVFDNVSWIMVLAGAVMLVFGGVTGTVGTYLAIAGVAILLLTQGRHKKGIIGKAVGGLASIYGATGYLSDILSYCRIFGMGLATTVIAMVFNTIASLFFGGIFGYIVGIIVLTVGHVFNIAINTLGAFVHTARLQYIEFFSKFFEGGGHMFKPLSMRTKNYRLED